MQFVSDCCECKLMKKLPDNLTTTNSLIEVNPNWMSAPNDCGIVDSLFTSKYYSTSIQL